MNIHQIVVNGVKEQLFLHDYLVIPGFGGFVLKRSHAAFAGGGNALTPPSKTISFNAQLRLDDGIMSAYLRQKMKCDRAQAINYLAEFGAYCRSVLEARGRLTMQGLGFFFLDLEGNTCFEPQADVNFLTSSFGLDTVTLREIAQQQKVTAQPVRTDRGPVRAEPGTLQRRNMRKLIVPGAAALIVFALIMALLTAGQFGGALRASLMSAGETPAYLPVIYPPLQNTPAQAEAASYVADANGIAVIVPDGKKEIAVRVLSVLPSEPRAAVGTKPVSHKFEIVAGCFSVESNAYRMVKRLKSQGVKAIISKKAQKGMHVVCIPFQTKDSAVGGLRTIPSLPASSWIREVQR